MKTFFARLWSRKPTRPTAGRRPGVRLQLEALEDRRLLSAGVIVSTFDPTGAPNAYYAEGQPVVYAIRSDASLWEYDPNFTTADHWEELSPAAFASISTTPYATQGGPVVFGILAADHSLWENSPAFNSTDPNPADHWEEVSPGDFTAIDTTVATVNGQQQAVVYGIVAGDHSLWENNPAFNPAAASLNDQWEQVSPGAFTAIAASYFQAAQVNSNEPVPPVQPAVFGIVAGDGSLWENDAHGHVGATNLNQQWVEVSTTLFSSISGDVAPRAIQAGGNETDPAVWAIAQSDQSLYQVIAAGQGQRQVSAAAWQAVSGPGPMLISAADQSAWGPNPGGYSASGFGIYAFVPYSPAAFLAVSADYTHVNGDSLALAFAEPIDHSLWIHDPSVDPTATDPNDQWIELSPPGTVM